MRVKSFEKAFPLFYSPGIDFYFVIRDYYYNIFDITSRRAGFSAFTGAQFGVRTFLKACSLFSKRKSVLFVAFFRSSAN